MTGLRCESGMRKGGVADVFVVVVWQLSFSIFAAFSMRFLPVRWSSIVR